MGQTDPYSYPTPREVLGQKHQALKTLINWLDNATDYYKICFHNVMDFLNMSTSLDTRLAAETHITDGQFL